MTNHVKFEYVVEMPDGADWQTVRNSVDEILILQGVQPVASTYEEFDNAQKAEDMRRQIHKRQILAALFGQTETNWARWGDQRYPDGTGRDTRLPLPRGIHRPLIEEYEYSMTSLTLEAGLGLKDFPAAQMWILADHFKALCQMHDSDADRSLKETWVLVLLEEVFEAFETNNDDDLVDELHDVGAVVVQWIAAIQDRERIELHPSTGLGSDDDLPGMWSHSDFEGGREDG